MDLYHVSRTHVDDIVWVNTKTRAYLPQQRSSLLPENNRDNRFNEPTNIDKISTAPSIKECVKGIWMIKDVADDAPMAVYRLQHTGNVSLIDHTLLNGNKLVHDANNTRETWVFGSAKFRRVGTVWIHDEDEHEITLRYLYTDPIWGLAPYVTNASCHSRRHK
mgnify:CR=1 FL=1